MLSLIEARTNATLFYSEFIARTVDELKRPRRHAGNNDLDAYVAAGNLAHYLGLTEVEALYVPVPVNLILVGFNGDGNFGLEVGEAELRHWFEHVDHVLQHTRVPRSGHGPRGAVPEVDHVHGKELPLLGYTHYNFSVHAISTGPKVSGMIEKAIYTFSRKEYLHTESDARHVDADFVAGLLGSLTEVLKLDRAYNVFLLNPKRNATGTSYGYRLGFSSSELRALVENPDRVKHALAKAASTTPSPFLDIRPGHRPFTPFHRPKDKFLWKLVSDDSDAWIHIYSQALLAETESLKPPHVHGASDIDTLFSHVEYAFSKGSKEHRDILLDALKTKGMGVQEDCLVDSWVGKERFVFLDLTAGPVSYGPIKGGEGMRFEGSVPSVERIFNSSAEDDLMPDRTNEDLEEELRTMAEKWFGSIDQETPSEADIVLAEVDIYEQFAARHCKGRLRPLTICDEIYQRMGDLQKAVWRHHGQIPESDKKIALAEAAARIRHRHHFFTPGVVNEEVAKGQRARARDLFLAEVGAIISKTLRHVVAPSTAQGTFRFYPRVNFRLYLIKKGKAHHNLDVAAFKEEMVALQLPGQSFHFEVNELALSADPALAMAFSDSLHATTEPTLLPDGTQVSSQRLYLDSVQLQRQLSASVPTRHSKKSARSSQRDVLDVPIFVFAVEGQPILLDHHHTARALPDMVLAVQANVPAWTSHLQCNGRPIYWDLRDPLKALIGATVHHLAGILPAHVTYSPSHSAVTKNWLWSVGPSPLSSTSSGWRLSSIHRDAVHRSYIVDGLDWSTERINQGIHILTHERTHSETFPLVRQLSLVELMSAYNTVVDHWAKISELLDELDFSRAISLLPKLEEDSQRFLTIAISIRDTVHPLRCTRRRKLRLGVIPVSTIACTGLLWALYLVLRPKRVKPKIN